MLEMETHKKHHKKPKEKKKEKLKYHTLISSAKSANRSRLTCFRSKSETLDNADPWKLMPNGVALFSLEETRKEKHDRTGKSKCKQCNILNKL